MRKREEEITSEKFAYLPVIRKLFAVIRCERQNRTRQTVQIFFQRTRYAAGVPRADFHSDSISAFPFNSSYQSGFVFSADHCIKLPVAEAFPCIGFRRTPGYRNSVFYLSARFLCPPFSVFLFSPEQFLYFPSGAAVGFYKIINALMADIRFLFQFQPSGNLFGTPFLLKHPDNFSR